MYSFCLFDILKLLIFFILFSLSLSLTIASCFYTYIYLFILLFLHSLDSCFIFYPHNLCDFLLSFFCNICINFFFYIFCLNWTEVVACLYLCPRQAREQYNPQLLTTGFQENCASGLPGWNRFCPLSFANIS